MARTGSRRGGSSRCFCSRSVLCPATRRKAAGQWAKTRLAFLRGALKRRKRKTRYRRSPSSTVACCRALENTGSTTTRRTRSEEHTSELQSHSDLVCRLLLEKKKK